MSNEESEESSTESSATDCTMFYSHLDKEECVNHPRLHEQIHELYENFNKQNKIMEYHITLSQEQNQTIEKLQKDLEKQNLRQKDLEKENKKQMDEIEKQKHALNIYKKQQIDKYETINDEILKVKEDLIIKTNDLETQLGDTNLLLLEVHPDNTEDDNLVPSSNSIIECSSNGYEVMREYVVFDIPTFFCCIFRFLFSITCAMIFFIKSNYWVSVVTYLSTIMITLSILFEMFAQLLAGKFKKIIFVAHAIGNIMFWISFANGFMIGLELKERSWTPLLTSGIINILSEDLIIVQMINGGISKKLIFAHVCNALGISFLLPAMYHGKIEFLYPFWICLCFQSILMTYGLPIKTHNIYQQIHTNDTGTSNKRSFENTNKFLSEELTVTTNTTSTPNKSITHLLLHQQQRLDSIETHLETPSHYFSINLLRPKGLDSKWTSKAQLSPDVYTMMMLSHWTQRTFHSPFSTCRNNQTFITIPRPSKPWMLGIIVFIVQTLLGTFTLLDQLDIEFGDSYLNIPIHISDAVKVGQFLTLILAIMTQTDVLVSFRVVLFLSYSKNTWQEIIGYDKNLSNYTIWFGRVVLPNVLKSFQGFIVLVTIFCVIVQSDNIVDLLKDFAALFVISSIDEMFFFMADHGYLGRRLARKSSAAKDINIEEDDSDIQLQLNSFLFLVIFSLFGGWITVLLQQKFNVFAMQKYPLCPSNLLLDSMGDGNCDYAIGTQTNILNCGWDGGDCIKLNELLPKCVVDDVSFLGNGHCDGGIYNSIECAWDLQDCEVFNNQFNEKYPDCVVSNPSFVGDGVCNGGPYNTKECGYDEGDCINCTGVNNAIVGNGICDGGLYNEIQCGFDGGDCLLFNQNFPDCAVDSPSLIGDGKCQGGLYNSKECGFDGGDCDIFKKTYPNCFVEEPYLIGDGICRGGSYNTEECGYDGGDCSEFNYKYPDCKVNAPTWIGDNECDGVAYNVSECDYDGGDCLI